MGLCTQVQEASRCELAEESASKGVTVQCLGTQSSRTVVLWEDRGWAGPSTKRNCVNGVLRQEDTRLSGDTRSPWEGRVSAVTEKGWGLNPEGLWDGAR